MPEIMSVDTMPVEEIIEVLTNRLGIAHFETLSTVLPGMGAEETRNILRMLLLEDED